MKGRWVGEWVVGKGENKQVMEIGGVGRGGLVYGRGLVGGRGGRIGLVDLKVRGGGRRMGGRGR